MRNNLRVVLASQKKNVSELHRLTGISRSTLASIANEKAKAPSILTFQKISEALNVSIDDLITTK